MHDRRGMCPEIMIFLPKSFGTGISLGNLFMVFFPLTHVVYLALFFIITYSSTQAILWTFLSLVFSFFYSLSDGKFDVTLGARGVIKFLEDSEVSNLRIWALLRSIGEKRTQMQFPRQSE